MQISQESVIFCNLIVKHRINLKTRMCNLSTGKVPLETSAVADPVFPRRGCQPLSLGRKPIIYKVFCQKLHKNERNWTWGEHTFLVPPWIRQCSVIVIV